MEYRKAEIINKRKTKAIYAVEGRGDLAIISNKDDITAFDDPAYTREFSSKGAHATTTTCRVFELLRTAGIPAAYREQTAPTEFAAERCRMIPLEVVARRLAVGSFLSRHPHLAPAGAGTLARFGQ